MGLAGREGRIFFLAAAGMAFAATCSASPLAIARASGETARLAVAEVPRAATANPAPAPTPVPGQAQAAVTQSLGTVKAINGNVITLTLDAGTDATVNVQDTTKIVQVAPGQKDLKTATPIHISDLQVGDRILVRSRAADDPKSVAALGIIAMKRTDVDAKKTQDREDWQKSGVGGLVKEVDPATGNITISVPAPAGPAKTTPSPRRSIKSSRAINCARAARKARTGTASTPWKLFQELFGTSPELSRRWTPRHKRSA